MYGAEDLAEVRRIINGFSHPIHIMNDGMVMIWDARNMEDVGGCLIDMGINQKNLGDCYDECKQEVSILREQKIT